MTTNPEDRYAVAARNVAHLRRVLAGQEPPMPCPELDRLRAHEQPHPPEDTEEESDERF